MAKFSKLKQRFRLAKLPGSISSAYSLEWKRRRNAVLNWKTTTSLTQLTKKPGIKKKHADYNFRKITYFKFTDL